MFANPGLGLSSRERVKDGGIKRTKEVGRI
jgi:hypothetical protein